MPRGPIPRIRHLAARLTRKSPTDHRGPSAFAPKLPFTFRTSPENAAGRPTAQAAPETRERRMSVPVEDVVACMPNLKRFARRLTRSEDAVEDLVQETVARALGNLDRYQPTGDLKAWLFTIMKNHVRDLWRKRRNLATVRLAGDAEIDAA